MGFPSKYKPAIVAAEGKGLVLHCMFLEDEKERFRKNEGVIQLKDLKREDVITMYLFSKNTHMAYYTIDCSLLLWDADFFFKVLIYNELM